MFKICISSSASTIFLYHIRSLAPHSCQLLQIIRSLRHLTSEHLLNVGKKQKLKPGDILGAIAGESGLPGRAVGSIDMYDKYTFVDVPSKYHKQVIKSMKHAKIKGNRVNVEKAERK